jgi:hypothetical protein
MKKFKLLFFVKFCVVLLLLSFSFSVMNAQFFYIFDRNGLLHQGYQIGVDSHMGDRDWLTSKGDYMELAYPGKQNNWGAVFVTIGQPHPDYDMEKREARDFRMFDTLLVDMRGALGGESVYIGMKDKYDLNNGREKKFRIEVNAGWKTYKFALEDFYTADKQFIHVPIEFVFEDQKKTTVFFRRIRFLLKKQ